MRLSHSKLSMILNNPAEYYLRYKQGIELKDRPAALGIGSAVHWGIENSTSDLSEYFSEGSFKQKDSYDKDQLLAESMAYGYLKHKESLFEQILRDPETGEKLELLDETHELPLLAKLKTNLSEHEDHEFEGIIDLLLLTNKGFIIVDYKTSSQVPDWDSYTDQLYRYIFLLKDSFPDTPVVKIGIINIRKTAIRPKKNESDQEFFNRLKFEYELNDENYINYHEYLSSDIDDKVVDEYIKNLSGAADLAQVIEDNKLFFINHANTKTTYGKSQYWNIFYNTPGAEYLYKIKDYLWDEDLQQFVEKRDCVKIDMLVMTEKVLNKYSIVKELFDKKEDLEDIKKEYKVDEDLLKKYLITYKKEKESKNER